MLPIPFPKHTTYAGHSGIDFPYKAGTLVLAGGRGKIVGRGYTSRAGYYVRVQYDDGSVRVFSCHFRNLAATPGVGVRTVEGTVIGAVGSTGNSTGDHLHQEVDGHATSAGYWRFHDRNRIVGQRVTPVGRNTTKRRIVDIQRVVGAVQDGKYGPATTAKVMEWQKRNGIAADGIWGPLSDAKAFAPAPAGGRPTIRRGSTGAHVLAVQTRLKNAYSLYAGKLALDSSFGPSTERAVKEFQRRSGLVADGVVGPKTWSALGLA